MITYRKIEKYNNNVRNTEYTDIARMEKNFFVRNRKMNLTKMIMFILAKRGLTLSMEIENFKNLMSNEMPDITESAICQQRKNLNPEIFRKLMRTYIEDTYDEGHDYDTYKGYLVFAIDGMKIELPNVPELQKEYGNNSGRKEQRPCVRAQTSSIYDVVNNMVIDSQIAPLKTSEKELAQINISEMIDILKDRIDLNKVIIIFDRGYPSTEMIGLLEELGIKYLFRLNSNKFKENVKQMKTRDEETKIYITKSRLNTIQNEWLKEILSSKEYLKSRLVKYELDTGEEEILLTNLREDEFKTNDIGELYFKRWKIELAYDIAKNKLEIQNISGHSKIVVEQDFYAQMYLLNIAEDLRKEANKKIKNKKENGYKYDYKINMNVLIGKMRIQLIEMMIRRVFFNEIESNRYQKMIEEISKNIVPIRTGRSNPRKQYKTRNKYRSNMRRNS